MCLEGGFSPLFFLYTRERPPDSSGRWRALPPSNLTSRLSTSFRAHSIAPNVSPLCSSFSFIFHHIFFSRFSLDNQILISHYWSRKSFGFTIVCFTRKGNISILLTFNTITYLIILFYYHYLQLILHDTLI